MYKRQALEAAARDIRVADYINGTKNTMQGTAKPLVVPQLAGHDSAWYLLCASRPIRPLIWQQRKKPKFVSKTAETDDNVFMRKTFLYGCLLYTSENDENVNTPEQRKKLRDWFYKAVSKAGDTYTDIVYIGTLLHYDALLANVAKNPEYEAVR